MTIWEVATAKYKVLSGIEFKNIKTSTLFRLFYCKAIAMFLSTYM